MTSVDLSGCRVSGCTGLVVIGASAFAECTHLKGVDLLGCRRLTGIEQSAFSGCSRLVRFTHVPSLVSVHATAFGGGVALSWAAALAVTPPRSWYEHNRAMVAGKLLDFTKITATDRAAILVGLTVGGFRSGGGHPPPAVPGWARLPAVRVRGGELTYTWYNKVQPPVDTQNCSKVPHQRYQLCHAAPPHRYMACGVHL